MPPLNGGECAQFTIRMAHDTDKPSPLSREPVAGKAGRVRESNPARTPLQGCAAVAGSRALRPNTARKNGRHSLMRLPVA
jgi:hypothetical protein